MPSVSFTDRFLKTLCTSRAQEEFTDKTFTAGGSLCVVVSAKGRKTFYHRYRVGNRKSRIKLGTYPALSLSAARIRAIENQRRVYNGEDPAAERKKQNAAETFEELAELFFERHVKEHLKAATQEQYLWMLESELLPLWGKRKAVDIKRRDVIELLDKIKGRGSPIMANRLRAAGLMLKPPLKLWRSGILGTFAVLCRRGWQRSVFDRILLTGC